MSTASCKVWAFLASDFREMGWHMDEEYHRQGWKSCDAMYHITICNTLCKEHQHTPAQHWYAKVQARQSWGKQKTLSVVEVVDNGDVATMRILTCKQRSLFRKLKVVNLVKCQGFPAVMKRPVGLFDRFQRGEPITSWPDLLGWILLHSWKGCSSST